MRISRLAGACALVAAAAMAVPALTATTSAAAAGPRTTPIGKQLAELRGKDTVARDDFGFAVALSGSTAVVGAVNHAGGEGGAYVFSETKGKWHQVAELEGSDTVAGDSFGSSVAVSGTIAVVGAPNHDTYTGSAYVFSETKGAWKQVAELEGADSARFDVFGSSVAVSGTTVVVGAVGHKGAAGGVYVFGETKGKWHQVAELEGSDTAVLDHFGFSVAVSGTTAVVGAPEHAKNTGRAYVFSETKGAWKQVAEVKGSDTGPSDYFGYSVAVSGTIAVVSSDDHRQGAGRAYVFSQRKASWKQTAELKGGDTVSPDHFGYSVAVSGTTAVVGAENHAKEAGRAYVFSETKGAWKQVAELKGSDTAAGDVFGASVAVSGVTALVGAYGHGDLAGRAYVFEA
ncbi:MAG: FG-GAP repeat protein [Acidimicrobiales bacterium]